MRLATMRTIKMLIKLSRQKSQAQGKDMLAFEDFNYDFIN